MDEMTMKDVPMLVRREIEAKIAAQIIDEFAKELGEEKTVEIAGRAIAKDAEAMGKAFAQAGNSMEDMVKNVVSAMGRGGGIVPEVREIGEDILRMDIVKCTYCDMYERIGLKKYGTLLSCARDVSLFKGFNPAFRFTRTGTIMEGASCCDFCLERIPEGE